MNQIAPETRDQAKTEFDLLRHGQFDRIEPALDPSIDRGHLRENLAKMAAMIPAQEPLSVKTIGAYAECDSRKGCQTQVTLEYQFPSKWLLVQVVVHKRDGKSAIKEFDIQSLTESLEQTNRFTLIGKSGSQYAFLFLTIVALGITLYALVLCIRTPLARRKWLWILFILFGIGQVEMNWTTGEVSHKIFHVLLLSGGTYGQPYGAWMFMVGVPLGAILFLMLRDRLEKKATSPTLQAEPPATAAV